MAKSTPSQLDELVARVDREIARNADLLDYIEELSTPDSDADIPVIDATHSRADNSALE